MRSKKYQHIQTIIVSFSKMMNSFFGFEVTPKILLYYKTMLRDITMISKWMIRLKNPNISRSCFSSSPFKMYRMHYSFLFFRLMFTKSIIACTSMIQMAMFRETFTTTKFSAANCYNGWINFKRFITDFAFAGNHNHRYMVTQMGLNNK